MPNSAAPDQLASEKKPWYMYFVRIVLHVHEIVSEIENTFFLAQQHVVKSIFTSFRTGMARN